MPPCTHRTVRAKTLAKAGRKLRICGSCIKGRSLIATPYSFDRIRLRRASIILGVSLTAVVRLIQKGALDPTNGLSRSAILSYRTRHALEQRKALANLTALSDEYDF